MKTGLCFWVLLFSNITFAECLDRLKPPGLGGAVDAVVSDEYVQRWKAYRSAREEERLLEAWDFVSVYDAYRLDREQINSGCVPIPDLIDLGRAIFLREFTPAEGLGHGARDKPLLFRFQKGSYGGPDATSCANCHWKGGFAGAGDRVDNAYLMGDGNYISSHQERNPIALGGAGWVELLAEEMTLELLELADSLRKRVMLEGVSHIELIAKGVSFGMLMAGLKDGEVFFNTSKISGVSPDLIVRPFGWQGTMRTLPDMIQWSFHMHLGLQMTEPRASSLSYGEGSSADPDSDGVQNEFTLGQLDAISVFIATLATPQLKIPVMGHWRPDLYVPISEIKEAPEFTNRWAAGLEKFEEIGCSSCHRPVLSLSSSEYHLGKLKIDLREHAAKPMPELRENGSTAMALFSDLKRHNMGDAVYLTRPLWGLRNSAPYMHDGSANVVDQAIHQHGTEGSEAQTVAAKFMALPEKEKADIRIFLYSLARAPAIRIR